MACNRPGVVVFVAHHGHYWVHLHAHHEPERMGRLIVSVFQRMHLALLHKCYGSEELDLGFLKRVRCYVLVLMMTLVGIKIRGASSML